MKKHLILFGFLFLISFLAQAQDNITLSLKGEKGYFPIKNDYYIEKIIDARTQKDCIGIFFSKESKKNIVLEKKLEDELSSFFEKHFQKTENKKPIILKINHFYMTDKKKMGERLSYVELRMSFIVRNEDNSLQEEFESSGINICSNVDFKEAYSVINLKKVFENGVRDFSVRKGDFLLPKPISLTEEKLYIPKKIEDYNCFKKPLKKRGLYNNFYDFRDQILDTTYFFYNNLVKTDSVKSYNDEYVTISKVKMTSLDRKQPWGYCDGEHNHVNINEYYYKIHEKDGLLLSNFRNYTEKEGPDARIFIIFSGAGIVGGLIGVLASAAIYEIVENREEKKEENSGCLVNISPISGATMSVNTNYYNKFTVLYDQRLLSIDTSLEVFIDGKKARTLHKYEFAQLDFSKKGQIVEVCFAFKDKKECVNIENKNIGEQNLVFAYFENEKSIKVVHAVSEANRTRYKDIFKSSSSNVYINKTIKTTHYKRDTTELIIVKSSSSFKSPTTVTFEGEPICSIDQNEYCKLKVALVESDPKVCFIDDKKRKCCFRADEDLGEKVLILLREDINYAMPKIYYKGKEKDTIIESIETNRTLKCNEIHPKM